METDVAMRQIGPICIDEDTGLLIYRDRPYELTIGELREHFVVNAPFSNERKFLFSVFKNYLDQTHGIVPSRRVWVDGSFVSLRKDRPPSDVDVLLLVDEPTGFQRRELVSRGLLTMSEVEVKIGDKQLPTLSKLAPYGGIIDAYYVDSSHLTEVASWEMRWTTPKDEHGNLDFEKTKGFVEVTSQ